MPDTTTVPTWQDLLPTITSAMPRNSDPDGSVARNIALAVEMELEWRAVPRTVEQRVSKVLLEHRQVTQDQVPGATVANPCSCGWGEWGHNHAGHVAEKLREAGLLVTDLATKRSAP